MKGDDQKTHEIGRLFHAISDFRNAPVAYPILAKYGYMERTPSGYVAISPEIIDRRCRELIDKLSIIAKAEGEA